MTSCSSSDSSRTVNSPRQARPQYCKPSKRTTPAPPVKLPASQLLGSLAFDAAARAGLVQLLPQGFLAVVFAKQGPVDVLLKDRFGLDGFKLGFEAGGMVGKGV